MSDIKLIGTSKPSLGDLPQRSGEDLPKALEELKISERQLQEILICIKLFREALINKKLESEIKELLTFSEDFIQEAAKRFGIEMPALNEVIK